VFRWPVSELAILILKFEEGVGEVSMCTDDVNLLGENIDIIKKNRNFN
jgi:hypothetical protein